MLVRVLWKYQVSKQNQLLQQKVTQSEKEENLSKMLDSISRLHDLEYFYIMKYSVLSFCLISE